ncbi:MAG: guanylate kinase [Pirellulaceae bacterium]|jgi:guanylate kinase|nr:guanylate kinase [Pirellulaceae bacterium]MDP7016596.1 guanylate kinase [Pirellulaceae bacterium]
MANLESGKLIIISGPSGSGKSTVVDQLLATDLPLEKSVSVTTRDPRPGETHNVDYIFMSREEFQEQRDAGNFLECMDVFGRENWYGTLRAPVATSLSQGKWVVLEIDVRGAIAVMEQEPTAITIFIQAPSLEELETRLRDRGTESEAAIQRRLEVARQELAQMDRYRHQIVNVAINQAVREICDILTQD